MKVNYVCSFCGEPIPPSAPVCANPHGPVRRSDLSDVLERSSDLVTMPAAELAHQKLTTREYLRICAWRDAMRGEVPA